MTDAAPAPAPSPLDHWPPRWEPAAVVFDCDGVLVDTEGRWVEAQTAYLREHEVELHDDVRRRITGGSAEVVLAVLAEAVGRTPEQVAHDLRQRHGTSVDHELVPLPGVVDLIALISERKPVAVASNSPRELLDLKLERLGLAPMIDASVAIEDVARPKPAPDMYAHAAQLLGAAPADTLGFEDSETGARAAVDAGLQLIAVPSIPGQHPAAPRTLESLADPQLHDWVRTWTVTR
ncbi:HAD family phosphatase [Brachybacterium sp. EF45031]|uniref:HAD family hydrolase n=1 Tax=Brachybacterium sillae TaxID=2810536 RepID=UPI00217D21A3|nr:HAD family phosphatase [Brachybacterium sillae]MCS6712198.1 HAD family phosphatase [Brachybacterium sillae]